MSESVRDISDSDFQTEVLESDIPVLVDFWAPWCGPCKSIAPVLEELSGQYQGKIKFVKVNVDENPKSPTDYRVKGIPTLMVFKGGEIVERIVGAAPKEQLTETLDRFA